MKIEKSLSISITGKVQGVGFRYFVRQQASDQKLTGWVKNNMDGSVEILATGPADKLEAFISQIKKGPQGSRIDNFFFSWIRTQNKVKDFKIL